MTALRDRTAIVTGASEGLGQAIAKALAAQGARIFIADVSDASETVKQIESAGGQAAATKCDVSSADDVARMVGEAEARFGSVDILVNNAGIYPFCPIESMTAEFWDRVFAVNVKGMFFCTAAVIPAMRKRGGGRIVNIASAIFFTGQPMASAYVASKGAVIGLSRSMARELGPANIRVNVITPGLYRTPGVANVGMPDEFFDTLVSQQAIPRMGAPEDVANVAVFLASDASDFMTGQIVNVDGGLVAH